MFIGLLAAACGDNSAAPDGGLDGGGRGDGSAGLDGSAPLLWVDFSVSGCAAERPGGPVDAGMSGAACVGEAPLALSFVAVAPSEIAVYAWNFGDLTIGDEPSPVHEYAEPGIYDVSLSVLGPGGNASVSKTELIEVVPAGLGGRCRDDDQCASGECVCADDDGDCPAGLSPGFCSAPCGVATACADGVCANLAPAPVGPPEDWQRSLCLVSCADGEPCPTGFVCRELRDGRSNGWHNACFAADLLADIGESCRDQTGALVNAACSSGRCLGEGARGLCSYACTTAPCPDSAACATFSGGNPAPSCLARCDSAGTVCTTDPWLDCEAPGGGGAKAFAIDELPPAAAGYCAPARCASNPECGPDGRCLSGFCAPL